MRRRKQTPGSPSTPPPPRPPQSASSQMRPPFSRSAFSAAAAADSSEQPCVVTDTWWLSKVEGHEGKISVGGFYQKGHRDIEFTAGPIAKRHWPSTLETEDGILVYLYGFFNTERTLENGFTTEACESFCLGFPYWWDEWNVHHPNIMTSQTGSQPESSRAGNSREDNTVPSASTLGSTNDECKVPIENASRLNKECQHSTVTSMGQPALHDKAITGEAIDVISSKKCVGLSRKQRPTFGELQHATRSSEIICSSPDGNLSPLICGWPKSLSISTPESLKLKKTRSGRVVVPPLDQGCQNIISAPDGSISAIVGLDSPPPLKGSMLKKYARKKKMTN